MQDAADLQADAWLAEKNAREYLQGIERRLMHGAQIQDCQYEFDPELQMVRSRKAERKA